MPAWRAGVADLGFARLVVDEPADVRGRPEDLVDADAARVPRVAARRAARAAVHRPVVRRRGPRAPAPAGSGSYASLQSSQMRRTRRCAMTIVSELATMLGSTPRSNRRDTAATALLVCSVLSTMWPGHRGLERDLGRLLVAHLADEDHVGVLAQDRPQHAGERQAGLRVDLDLVDARQLVLDRVLDRDDVDLGAVVLGEQRVERRALARPGRPRHEDHALRLGDGALEHLLLLRRQAEPRRCSAPTRRPARAGRSSRRSASAASRRAGRSTCPGTAR